MQLQFRLTGQETAGQVSLVEAVAPPGGGPAFLHAHPAAETFYVLEGEFEFFGQANGQKVGHRGGPGFIHHSESNAPHAVRNVGSVPGRVLLIFHPADIQEAFFREVTPIFRKPPETTVPPGPPSPADLEKILAIAARHKIRAIERPG